MDEFDADTIKLRLRSIIGLTRSDRQRLSLLSTEIRDVPLDKMSRDFLREVVLKETIIAESHSCSNFIFNVLSNILNDTPKIGPKENSVFDLQSLSEALQGEKYLYCFGGKNENNNFVTSVSKLNISTRKWNRDEISFPNPRAHFSGAVIKSKIYLCGGWTDNETFNIMEMFDRVTNTWKVLEPMPKPRWYSAAASLDGFVYVTGGADNWNKCLSSVIRYCVETNQWQEVEPMNERRRSHQLVALNGYLYAIGGWCFNEKVKTVEKYDPGKGWEIIGDLKDAYSFFGATTREDKIYVCGNKVFGRFSPELINNFETLNRPSKEFHNGRTLVSTNNSKLLLIGGGKGGSGGTKTIMEFDIDTGEWTKWPNMDVARMYHCSFIV